jgi:hypothetical protein
MRALIINGGVLVAVQLALTVRNGEFVSSPLFHAPDPWIVQPMRHAPDHCRFQTADAVVRAIGIERQLAGQSRIKERDLGIVPVFLIDR